MNKDNAGFTLVEVLCTVLVVVLLTGMIVTGITFGVKNYGKNLTISEARTLYCTLSTVISDNLRFSSGVVTGNQNKVTSLFIPGYGEITENVFRSDADGRVFLGEDRILSNSAYTRGAKAKVDVTYNPDSETFGVDITVSSSKGDEIYSQDFEVKQLNGNT